MDIAEYYNCIKDLKKIPEYFAKWETLRNIYKPILDGKELISDQAYVPHDYTRHCVNIYNNLDMLLNSTNLILNIEELFILDVAILLHDIIMVYNPYARNSHSEDGKRYILNKMYGADCNSELLRIAELSQDIAKADAISKEVHSIMSKMLNGTVINHVLSPDEAQCIADVIFGHSDIKATNGKISTIELLPKADEFLRGTLGKDINVRLLAALLRLTDELDISSNRIKGIQHDSYNINEESKEHWRKCALFRVPKINNVNKTEILLLVDDNAFGRNSDKKRDSRLIIETENKINKELRLLNQNVFYNSLYNPSGWAYQRAKIVASSNVENDIEQVRQELENKQPKKKI